MTVRQIIAKKDDGELFLAFRDIEKLHKDGHIGSGAFSAIVLELEDSGVPGESSLGVAESSILYEIALRWVEVLRQQRKDIHEKARASRASESEKPNFPSGNGLSD